ncbi:aldehyde dehydrogenase [Priestia megaterium]|nr:aldehyde dehydrogenase family protein [Priestia megaterium]PFI59203.1 aldehyde dehydrogenase [Priestia megaterium]
MIEVNQPIKRELFINGEWKPAKHYKEVKSPYSNEVIGTVPVATKTEVLLAIDAAYQACSKMVALSSFERAQILENLARLLEDRKEEAAYIIAREAAKPLAFAKAEVARSIETYKFAAEEAKRIHGETIPLDAAAGGKNRLGYTVREPIGVIGAITPFNFPMNLMAHKVGPAIAAGNTIVLKPASQTPFSALFIAELLEQAGLPKGALNIITGSGSVIGDIIVTDERISMITFTGSPSVGIAIKNKAGLKRVTLELGSNSALIVDDVIEVDKIISRCITGAFSFQGQVCISLQRVYVHENKYDEFVEKFVKATKELKIGDPLDESTDISALISSQDVKRSLSWIEEAKSEGAIVMAGGVSEGDILLPTVLVEVNKEMKVSCQEVFAPIVVINKVNGIDEAIEHVNDSNYGLQAGIYTESVSTALRVADKLHVGGIMINDVPTFRVDQMPYGGVKESGTGREGIKYAIEEMTEMKLVVWNKEY